MSLEAAVQKNTETLLELISAIKADGALRLEISGKIEAAAKAAGTPKTTKAAATEKAAEPAAEPNITKTPEDRKDPAAEGKTIEKAAEPAADTTALQEQVKAFMGAATSEADRAARRATVKEKLDKLGAPRVSEIKAADVARFGKAMDKLAVEFSAKPADEDDL